MSNQSTPAADPSKHARIKAEELRMKLKAQATATEAIDHDIQVLILDRQKLDQKREQLTSELIRLFVHEQAGLGDGVVSSMQSEPAVEDTDEAIAAYLAGRDG